MRIRFYLGRNRYPIFIFSFFIFAALSQAHNLGEGYLYFTVGDQGIDGRIEATLTDLNKSVSLDKNKDGKISKGELDANIDQVKAYVDQKLKFWIHDVEVPFSYTSYEIRKTHISKYLMLHFKMEPWKSVPEIIGIDYLLLFDSDPTQRGFLVVEKNSFSGSINTTEQVSLIFTPARPHQKFNLKEASWMRQFIIFVGEGIWHIWIGIDHILFIIALILISVVTRKDGKWEGVPSFGKAFMNLLKIVTVFTIAHSITLGLAALGIVQLSSRIVESVIAASVVVAALNNFFPIFRGRDWLILFGFGLFHGLGFASVLGDLIFSKQSLVIALFGFNVGVEIGQLGIVCLSFPIFYFLRNKMIYNLLFLKVGSAVIGTIAFLWFIERAFEMEPILGIF